MECVSAIIGPVVGSLIVPIKKHLDYLTFSTSYISKMDTSKRQLDDTRVDVEGRMEANNTRNLEIPTHVPGWLEEVEKIKLDVESIPTGGNRFFNIRMRYKAGRKASKITREIERLIKENSETIWTDNQIPLGKVNSKEASTSTGGITQNDFRSRDWTFKEALKALQPGHKTRMIALCGMGGVGKSTMMEQLKKAVEDKKSFDWVVKAVIGEKTNPIAVQQAVADYMGQALSETTKEARADRLHKRFVEMSKDGKNKILVILDDVWEMVDLKDIGLSPLPNKGVGFKLLLTSRSENICTQMGVDTNSVFRVEVMKEREALNFFCQIAGISHELNPDLSKVGKDIVRMCGFLPLAITLIATTLRSQEKFVWSDALHRLKKHDLDGNISKIVEISYNNLKKEEAKMIFLLCGLFPEDFDIPIGDLTLYGWGLKLFNEVHTLGDARDRTNTCVQDLRSANLLIGSDRVGCVKMHDLVRAFVLNDISKGKHAWIVDHGNMLEWPTQDTSKTYERISLTCTSMSELPRDFSYENLTFLKLMHGDKSLSFADAFYEKMEKLRVIAFDKMQYPMLPRSLQYSTNLQTLCLRSCSLMDDFSPIGNLINLEVLSFAHCSIRKLPSTIGKLRKLKLLDLTGCVDLRIDDGVFRNLVCLEELFMRVADRKAIRFTDANSNELKELSENLTALEIEFFENNAEPKNVLFKNLRRFKISIGCYLKGNEGKDMYSFENTLMLVTNRNLLLEYRINELFWQTEVLHLQVYGMTDLQDISMESLDARQHLLFPNLRVLDVSECSDLTYLFSLSVARGLSKLEKLTISSCPIMEEVIHTEDGKPGMIIFHKLKFLFLKRLQNLVSLCTTMDVIELPELVELRLEGLPNFTSIYPGTKSATSSISDLIYAIQPFLNEKVETPKLEILKIGWMKNLKEIWPCQCSGNMDVNICTLREIRVESCWSLVNVFPANPMSWLHQLEYLSVENCPSVGVIFNLDLKCIDKGSSSLRKIDLKYMLNHHQIWILDNCFFGQPPLQFNCCNRQ